MQRVVHKAAERGVAEHSWLHSRFSFSFADWYEPTRMGFGALRVINDDTIDPSSGFGMHPHRDTEIITIVTDGTVTHQDSLGNRGEVRSGEVQVMSAGTGVVHSETNESTTEALKLFQIWILADRNGHEPRYAQKAFPTPTDDEAQLLVGPWGSDAPLTIHQDAYITRVRATKHMSYKMHGEGNGLYAFVVAGHGVVAGEELRDRDAIGVWEADEAEVVPAGTLELLLIEVPMR